MKLPFICISTILLSITAHASQTPPATTLETFPNSAVSYLHFYPYILHPRLFEVSCAPPGKAFDVTITPTDNMILFPFKNGGRQSCPSSPCIVTSHEPFRPTKLSILPPKKWPLTTLLTSSVHNCTLHEIAIHSIDSSRLVFALAGLALVLGGRLLSEWQPFRLTTEASVLLAGFFFTFALVLHRMGVGRVRSLLLGSTSSLLAVATALRAMTGTFFPTPRLLLANQFVLLSILIAFGAALAVAFFFDDPSLESSGTRKMVKIISVAVTCLGGGVTYLAIPDPRISLPLLLVLVGAKLVMALRRPVAWVARMLGVVGDVVLTIMGGVARGMRAVLWLPEGPGREVGDVEEERRRRVPATATATLSLSPAPLSRSTTTRPAATSISKSHLSPLSHAHTPLPSTILASPITSMGGMELGSGGGGGGGGVGGGTGKRTRGGAIHLPIAAAQPPLDQASLEEDQRMTTLSGQRRNDPLVHMTNTASPCPLAPGRDDEAVTSFVINPETGRAIRVHGPKFMELLTKGYTYNVASNSLVEVSSEKKKTAGGGGGGGKSASKTTVKGARPTSPRRAQSPGGRRK